jgi:DNA-directed RNA polymerase subunit RPC12/RpoP
MAEKVIYICDRCGREKIDDRSYWKSIFFGYVGEQTLLCQYCMEAFRLFLKNKPTETTYIVQS